MSEIELVANTTLALPRGDTHPINAYLNSLSEGSRVGQLSAIVAAYAAMRGERLEDQSPEVRAGYRDEGIWAFPWHELRHEHMAALRSRLQEIYSPATANKYLSVARSLLKSCWRLGHLDHDTLARAVDVKPIKGQSPPVGRDVTYEEVVLLMQACSADGAQGVRDQALFGIGHHTAPRIREVSNLDLADYDPETGKLTIRKGKGSKTREVFVSGGAKQGLDDWIEIRGQEPGALFLPIRKDGLIQHVRANGKGPEPARMSTWAISKRLERRRLQAGLDPLTWHDWRRSLAGDLIDSGDLAGAQLTLGHSSPAVTMRYSRRDLQIVQDVLAKRQTPYIKANGAQGEK